MTSHYEESVELVRTARPESSFFARLQDELDRLRADIATPAEPDA